LVVGVAAPVVTVSDPVCAPVAVGENVTPIVQVPLAAIVFPLHVSLVMAYWLGVAAEDTNGRPTMFGLVNVSVSGPPVVPTPTLPNASGLGEPVGDASVPLPLSVIIEGVFLPLLLTVSVSEHAPAAVGAKFTVIAHEAGGGVGPVDPVGPSTVPVHPSLST
jgi:hypothetical protein